MSVLFSPVQLGPVEVRNRAWVSPMCQYSCEEQDGMPSDWHREHLTSFARGGAGLVMTEAAAIEPIGRISPQDLGIWNDAQAEALAPIAARIRAHGAVAAVQLAHAGRKASTYREWSGRGSVPLEQGGWPTVSAGAAAFGSYAAPRALAADEVAALPERFAVAARRAVDAGFEAVEVHAAHGYLLHQFLSPLSNARDDEWGVGEGGLRTLLLQRVVEAVRAAVPEAALMVRLSASDWVDGGIDSAMTVEHVRVAIAAGADWFDLSSGGLDPRQEIPLEPGYQVPFARDVRAATGAKVNAVGLIEDPAHAESVLVDGDADAVMLARAWMRNPHWALGAEAELDGVADASVWPPQYTRARRVPERAH
ncbi:oxidoreductase [Agrococcus jenensis]|uniref:2,4-dienoyl-CoA reductase-like NADH-dependent reductase (Old Yellow Enzyme family) n=1 Tax=Agrococcus jenensis TaxID=46353 RepID=A0A3N2ATG4_9MICO|nr:oxidoreductase [Agrococcus jenensis]ROR66276.1 2,4-dienoyl-CoA reductase-like NADH-dependent reductase (Old Yellow Enzyme family) [Agrococcus jenensis]